MENPSPAKPVSVHLVGHDHVADIDPKLPLKKWLYAWLFDPNIPGNYQKSVDRWIGILIVANLGALLFEHVEQIYAPNKHWFHWFDVLSVAVFTLEYVVRLFLAPEDEEFKKSKRPRLRYIRSPFAIIDFLAIAPFYLQAFIPLDLRFLRFLRLMRILKLFRVLIPAYKEFAFQNRGRTFRQRMHALVFPSQYGGTLHVFFDNFIAFWVVIAVLAVVLESVQSIHYILNIQFVILDAVAVGVFTLEYCMRIYCCVEEPAYKRALAGRLKLAKTPALVIDFLAIIPFFLEVLLHHLFDLRFLRVFRLARLLKLTRYTGATSTLTTVIKREWPVMSAAAFVMLLLVVLTASLGYLFEHEAQPDKFENIPQAIYWAVMTLASVGYGDISPVTPMGRAMTIVLALIGIGIFAIPAALLSSAFTDELTKERDALKSELSKMLSDGVIDADEAATINLWAKRLHLKQVDIDLMIETARKARESENDLAKMPIHRIAANPEHAVEHYKALFGQIRELGILTDLQDFERVSKGADRLTLSEFAVWRHITKGGNPPSQL